MSIRILKQGLLTSLQSVQRPGYRRLGIGPGGAMDPFAMQVANYLVGNEEGAPVMEMNFPAPELLFQKDALISLAGADFDACVSDQTIQTWRPVFIKKGSVLRFRKPIQGSKSYMAVQGGWRAEYWLGSANTHLKAKAGGFSGRALQKEDVIDFGEQNFYADENKVFPGCMVQSDLDSIYREDSRVRCVRGAEWNLLSDMSKEMFEEQAYIINNQSDRMGYRLNGNPLFLSIPLEMVSSAVDAGTVQLLADGNLIVLMADHQTTGGYPRIASVIRADMPSLAQMNPGRKIVFTAVEPIQAEEALISMQGKLQEIKETCLRHYQNDFRINRY